MRNKIKQRKKYKIGKSPTPLCKISILLKLGKPHKKSYPRVSEISLSCTPPSVRFYICLKLCGVYQLKMCWMAIYNLCSLMKKVFRRCMRRGLLSLTEWFQRRYKYGQLKMDNVYHLMAKVPHDLWLGELKIVYCYICVL